MYFNKYAAIDLADSNWLIQMTLNPGYSVTCTTSLLCTPCKT